MSEELLMESFESSCIVIVMTLRLYAWLKAERRVGVKGGSTILFKRLPILRLQVNSDIVMGITYQAFLAHQIRST